MVWSVHMLAVWWMVDMDGVISAHAGNVVVCGGHGWRGQCTCWQCGTWYVMWWTWGHDH